MTRKFEGLSEAHPYYVLEPVYQGGILYVPADNPKIPKEAVPDYIARRLGTEPAARS